MPAIGLLPGMRPQERGQKDEWRDIRRDIWRDIRADGRPAAATGVKARGWARAALVATAH